MCIFCFYLSLSFSQIWITQPMFSELSKMPAKKIVYFEANFDLNFLIKSCINFTIMELKLFFSIFSFSLSFFSLFFF